MENESIFAYKGDPPERLVDETSDLVDAWKEKFAPLVSEAAGTGFSVQVLLGYHDPLTDFTHTDSIGKGDMFARIGLAQQFVKDKLD